MTASADPDNVQYVTLATQEKLHSLLIRTVGRTAIAVATIICAGCLADRYFDNQALALHVTPAGLEAARFAADKATAEANRTHNEAMKSMWDRISLPTATEAPGALVKP